MARALKAYIAASWPNRQRLRDIRHRLSRIGIRTTSQWLDLNQEYDEGDFLEEAKRDYRDIDRADFVFLDTTDRHTQGGRDWEAGYATGRGKRVVRVGPIITPFHAGVNLGFETWDHCLAHFATALEHATPRDN